MRTTIKVTDYSYDAITMIVINGTDTTEFMYALTDTTTADDSICDFDGYFWDGENLLSYRWTEIIDDILSHDYNSVIGGKTYAALKAIWDATDKKNRDELDRTWEAWAMGELRGELELTTKRILGYMSDYARDK